MKNQPASPELARLQRMLRMALPNAHHGRRGGKMTPAERWLRDKSRTDWRDPTAWETVKTYTPGDWVY